MAVWQYDLFLVKEKQALPLSTDDGWELPPLPAASTLGAQASLAGPLGCPWWMMDDWVVFGQEAGTRVDLLFDGADKVEIRIRLGLPVTEAELGAICTFARELDARLFDPSTGALLEPDHGALAAALDASRAKAFSRTPRAFLSGQLDRGRL